MQEVTLHPLLAARMDDSLLLRALRGLTAQQATRVAAYLQKWLHNFAGRCPALLLMPCSPLRVHCLMPELAHEVLLSLFGYHKLCWPKKWSAHTQDKPGQARALKLAQVA